MIDVLVDNVMVNCLNMYLRSLAEMRPKLAVGSGNGYFLVVHNYDVVSGCKNREKNIMSDSFAFCDGYLASNNVSNRFGKHRVRIR